jgi:hypothetical protein
LAAGGISGAQDENSSLVGHRSTLSFYAARVGGDSSRFVHEFDNLASPFCELFIVVFLGSADARLSARFAPSTKITGLKICP